MRALVFCGSPIHRAMQRLGFLNRTPKVLPSGRCDRAEDLRSTRIHHGADRYRWIDPAFPTLSITPIRGWQHALQSVSHDNDLDRHDLCLVDNDYSETMVIHA